MSTKPTEPGDGPRTPHGMIFLIVFLDIVGFSILFPLFPALLEHYVAQEGSASMIGRLAAFLAGLADGNEFAVVALFGGILGAVYSILQFAFAPFWGSLSDRIGRRPTLLVTLLGTVVAYVLWIFAGSFALLIVSRLLAGVMAGNISTASAVIADTTPPEKRASGMGFIGMSIGLGFIFGPAIGGISAQWMSTPPAGGWAGGFALNPFSAPAIAATILATLNLVLVAARLRESLPEEHRAPADRRAARHPFGAARRIGVPAVTSTTFISFLYTTLFSAMEFTLTFLAVERFAYTPKQNAWMFVFVGFTIAFVQGGIVRRVAPRLGERRVVVTGLGLLIPGLLAIGSAGSTTVLYLGLFFLAVGSALAMPCLSSLVSRYAPRNRQGEALGAFRSAGSLARALGPLLGGVLFWQLGSEAPYLLAAVGILAPIALTLRLPPLPE